MKNTQRGSSVVWFIVIIILLVVVGGYYFNKTSSKTPEANSQANNQTLSSPIKQTTTASNLTLSDINNAEYIITGTKGQFSNGKFHPEEASALSANQGLNSVISSYAFGDINNDGWGDAVVVTTSGLGVRDARISELQLVLDINGKPQTKNFAVPIRAGENSVLNIAVISIDNSGLITLKIGILPPNGDLYNTVTHTRTYRYITGQFGESQS